MTLRRIPPLDVQIGEVLDAGLRRDVTVARVLAVVENARDRPCTDPGCARRREHSVLGPHAWRHDPDPPFGHPLPFTRTCFTCGQPTWARIHKVTTP